MTVKLSSRRKHTIYITKHTKNVSIWVLMVLTFNVSLLLPLLTTIPKNECM